MTTIISTAEQFARAARAEIARVKSEKYASGYQASDAEALGLALAEFFDWDGLALLRAAQYALEDANFHTESARVSEMADKVEAE